MKKMRIIFIASFFNFFFFCFPLTAENHESFIINQQLVQIPNLADKGKKLYTIFPEKFKNHLEINKNFVLPIQLQTCILYEEQIKKYIEPKQPLLRREWDFYFQLFLWKSMAQKQNLPFELAPALEEQLQIFTTIILEYMNTVQVQNEDEKISFNEYTIIWNQEVRQQQTKDLALVTKTPFLSIDIISDKGKLEKHEVVKHKTHYLHQLEFSYNDYDDYKLEIAIEKDSVHEQVTIQGLNIDGMLYDVFQIEQQNIRRKENVIIPFENQRGSIFWQFIDADRIPQQAIEISLQNQESKKVFKQITAHQGGVFFEQLPPGKYSVFYQNIPQKYDYSLLPTTFFLQPKQTHEGVYELLRVYATVQVSIADHFLGFDDKINLYLYKKREGKFVLWKKYFFPRADSIILKEIPAGEYRLKQLNKKFMDKTDIVTDFRVTKYNEQLNISLKKNNRQQLVTTAERKQKQLGSQGVILFFICTLIVIKFKRKKSY